jgi:hypothetical protein
MAPIFENIPKMITLSLPTQAWFNIDPHVTMGFDSALAWQEQFKIGEFLRASADLHQQSQSLWNANSAPRP